MKDDYTTNSHYLTYTLLFRKVGRMYFLNLEVEGLTFTLCFTLLIMAGPKSDDAKSITTES